MKKRIIIITMMLIFILGAGVISCYMIIGNLNQVEIDKSDEALGIKTNGIDNVANETSSNNQNGNALITPVAEKEREDIVNIALFGVDRRSSSEKGRSDAMIILTIDFKTKKIKLSSLMRDMHVIIDGYGETKLTHAYAYGGAQLAIKTINETFGTNIRDYATVDFFTLEKIIDVFGGVKINVKKDEIKLINGYMNETSRIEGTDIVKVEKAGEQTLNGMQAVAYSRIRYVGNGDFERTLRQRKVISAIIEKTKVLNLAEITSLINEIFPLVETSMNTNDILCLAIDYLKAGEMKIEEQRFPVDGYWENNMDTGVYYLDFESEETKRQVINYIFNDIAPIPKSKYND